jgi:hypothetical protein
MRNYFGIRQWIWMLAILAPLSAPAQEHFNLVTTTKYAGRAFGLQISPGDLASNSMPINVVDSGPVPTTGGQCQNFLRDGAPVAGVSALELDALTQGDAGANRSQAWLAHLDAKLGTHHLTALFVESEAAATTGKHAVPLRGKSILEGLTVDGQPMTITGKPNQMVALRDGYLVINEEFGSSSPHFRSVTVNALHLSVIGAGSLVAASSRAEVIYTPLPKVGF